MQRERVGSNNNPRGFFLNASDKVMETVLLRKYVFNLEESFGMQRCVSFFSFIFGVVLNNFI